MFSKKKINFESDKPYVIMLGLDTMQGLQYSRIFHSHKIPVIGISDDPKDHGCYTNTCDKIFSCNTGNNEILDLLLELGPKFKKKPVIITCIEKNVFNIAKNKELLGKFFHIKLPSPDVIDLMIDKIKFLKSAQKENLPIPISFILSNRTDALEASEKINYPCILKPNNRTETWIENTTLKAFKIFDKNELMNYFDKYFKWSDGMLAQEWIEGPDSNHYTCNQYYNEHSEPLVSFVSRKIRQWPPETGQGCFSIEAKNDIVQKVATDLFKNVNFVGFSYLDMKLDNRTGKHLIVEPNVGRPTGRSPLAEAAGVEFVMTMYCDCVGLPLPENRTQKFINAKWIHIRRDLQAFLRYHKNQEITLKEWLNSLKGPKAYAIFSWKDPLPFFGDLYRVLKIYLKKNEKYKNEISKQTENQKSTLNTYNL